MYRVRQGLAGVGLAVVSSITGAQAPAEPPKPATPAAFDADLARSVGADERGMRSYVLVILKTGPKPMAKGPERDAMFAGHFANMKRLADEGKLAVAGPLDGVDGWRGLFVMATGDIEEARGWVATDPVVINGEMVAEFHKHYGSAALMLVNGTHAKIAKKSF
jgi:uncharacterized protein YciI